MPEIDNITISVEDSIDNILVSVIDEIESLNINVITSIDNIILGLGDGALVDSINGLIGNVNLTSATTLSLTSVISGVYSHEFDHNLNYQYPIVNIFNNNNELIISDIQFNSVNRATIKALKDLTGYKVVAQR